MYFDFTFLEPWTFMLGFAWHKEHKLIEVFVGLFAMGIKYGE